MVTVVDKLMEIVEGEMVDVEMTKGMEK